MRFERSRWLARKYGPARIRHDLRAKAFAESWSRAPAPAPTSSSRQPFALKKSTELRRLRVRNVRAAHAFSRAGASPMRRSAARWISPATTPLCS